MKFHTSLAAIIITASIARVDTRPTRALPHTFTSFMAELSSGVTVVTTTDSDGRPVGLTSTAVCSLSLDPPLALVCVSLTSRTLPIIRAQGAFAVNILDDKSRHVAERFATRSPDKFDGVEWIPSPGGMPLLINHALAGAEFMLNTEFEAGDHVVLVGEMTYAHHGVGDGEPLAHFRRSYSR